MKIYRPNAQRTIAAVVSAFLFCGWSAAASASATEFGDVQIIVQSRRDANRGMHGYALYRFMVSNRSTEKTREVELRLPDRNYAGVGGNDASIRGISKKFEVAPSSTVYVPIYQPALRIAGNGVSVSIDGRKQSQNISLPLGDHAAHFSSASSRRPFPRGSSSGTRSWVSISSAGTFEPRVLLSYSADESDMRRLSTVSAVGTISFGPPVPSGGSSRPPVIRTASVATNVDFINSSGFMPNWLSYSSFDGCVLAVSDAQGLERGELSALWQYVECGGSLAVMGKGTLPAIWKELDARLDNLELDENTFERYRIGLGVLFLTGPPDALYAQNPNGAKEIAVSWEQSGDAWGTLPTAEGANAMLQMVEPMDASSSLKRMFTAMLIFAIAIGPVNLIVLAKSKRRSWIFWTTPAVAALACAAVFLYATFSEGWGKFTRYSVLTVLNENVNRASTIGMVGYYSPLTDSGGLMFENSSELTPLVHGSAVSGHINWTNGQHFQGDWIKARIPRHFKVRKNETRRERVTLRRDGNTLKMVNGLGAGIKSISYVDHDGRKYQASGIAEGDEAELKEMAQGGAAGFSLRQVYAGRDWVAAIESVKRNPIQYLEPGRYLAELEENVFFEEALDGAKVKSESTAMVMGIVSNN